MFRKEAYDLLQRRSLECEEMSLTARDVSIRQKFTQLAMEYRGMAERMHLLDYFETHLDFRLSACSAVRTCPASKAPPASVVSERRDR